MTIDLLFFVFGIGLSFFYGLCSYRVFTYPHTNDVYTKNDLKKFDVTKRARFHEAWTYFVCSALGWLCLYLLYSSLFKSGIDNFDLKMVSVNHFMLLLIGLLGVIGFLPRALWNLSASILELTKKITQS